MSDRQRAFDRALRGEPPELPDDPTFAQSLRARILGRKLADPAAFAKDWNLSLV